MSTNPVKHGRPTRATNTILLYVILKKYYSGAGTVLKKTRRKTITIENIDQTGSRGDNFTGPQIRGQNLDEQKHS